MNYVQKVNEEVRRRMENGEGSHNWDHVRQVRDIALRVAQIEGGDKELIEIAALVHDIGDRKYNESEEAGHQLILEVLGGVWRPTRYCGTGCRYSPSRLF